MLQFKNYYSPETVNNLFDTINAAEKPWVLIAGGTDLYAKEHKALKGAVSAVDISGIDEFRRIDVTSDTVTVGAATTIQRFCDDPVLIGHLPLMRHTACFFADQQIRQMATLGGNLANASPVGDTIPCLMVLEARINTCRMENGAVIRDRIPMAGFVNGVGKTALRDGEIISSVTFPVLQDYGCAFKKVGLRRSLCISTANAAFMVKVSPDKETFEDVRIAYGAVGPTPMRVSDVEQYLKGKPVSADVIEDSVSCLPEDLIRSRSRREYRKIVAVNFLKAGLAEALADAGISVR